MNSKSARSTILDARTISDENPNLCCSGREKNYSCIHQNALRHLVVVPVLVALLVFVSACAGNGFGQRQHQPYSHNLDQDVADYTGSLRGVSHLNVRSGPAMAFRVVDIIDKHAVIRVTHHNSLGWAKIFRSNGEAAYVSMKYISRDPSLDTVDRLADVYGFSENDTDWNSVGDDIYSDPWETPEEFPVDPCSDDSDFSYSIFC